MLCKIWGLHGGDNEEYRLLGFEVAVVISQGTHYISATEPSRLMVCQSLGFHGDDYEEYIFLGYKMPVRTSQETQYISTTVLSRLMLRKIWDFHGSDYEECRLLEFYAELASVRIDVAEDLISSIRVTRIGELGTTLAITSNRSTLHSDTFLRNVGSYKSPSV
jgi:hypothetical protein